MPTLERPRCPDARRKPFSETDTCDLNDKMCLLESNTPCAIYEDFLAEFQVEEARLSELVIEIAKWDQPPEVYPTVLAQHAFRLGFQCGSNKMYKYL